MAWEPANFLIASYHGPETVAGYIYRGLGLSLLFGPSPKGRRPPTWSLTHLGSGHQITFIRGKVAVAFPIASEIAECGEWDWDGLDGWRNRDPDLPAKTLAVIERHKAASREGGGSPFEQVARQIATARAI